MPSCGSVCGMRAGAYTDSGRGMCDSSGREIRETSLRKADILESGSDRIQARSTHSVESSGSRPIFDRRKINSRGTTDEECGPSTGNENGEWETTHINDWFLALKVGVLSHVLVSPFGISDPPGNADQSRTGRRGESANRNFRD